MIKKIKKFLKETKKTLKRKRPPEKNFLTVTWMPSVPQLRCLVFAVRKLTEEEAKDIEEAVHQIKYPKARKYLEEFFDTE